jgi:RNA polymerase sigma-70 factor (ECF subfamily)
LPLITIAYKKELISTEIELIDACLRQETYAQRVLFDTYSAKLLGVCYRYASSQADAEDILQEAFVKIFNKLDNFRRESSLETWMTRIVINTAISHLRLNKKHQNESDLEVVENNYSFSNEQFNQIDAKILMNAIQELPDNYRVVLNMFAIEGYSHKEIAEELGIPEVTSRSHFFRAKSILEKKLLNINKMKLAK